MKKASIMTDLYRYICKLYDFDLIIHDWDESDDSQNTNRNKAPPAQLGEPLPSSPFGLGRSHGIGPWLDQ